MGGRPTNAASGRRVDPFFMESTKDRTVGKMTVVRYEDAILELARLIANIFSAREVSMSTMAGTVKEEPRYLWVCIPMIKSVGFVGLHGVNAHTFPVCQSDSTDLHLNRS